MRRSLLILLGLIAACASAGEATQAPATPVAQSPATAAGSVGLHEAVAKAAVTAPTVEEFEFRLDASGALVKQAVYHDDAGAISQAVKDKALEVFPGATITHYETEHYADAGVVHEVEVKTAEGQTCEVAATPDGTLRYQECEVAVDTAPASVKDAVENRFPGGKIVEVETKKGPEIDVFSVEVEHGGTEYYVQVSPDGTMQSVHKRIEATVEIPVSTR